MRRYQWPGHGMQLLGGLQSQQNKAKFCDVLLQTEGISVPAHSCILAVLSPYLSWKLSASPSPPSGQIKQLQLQNVKAKTLLKLVGLLYSGELQLDGSVEQNDVLSAAHQLGITDLVEGRENGKTKDNEKESRECQDRRMMRDAQVQSDAAEGTARDSPIKKRSCKSTGTQTGTPVDLQSEKSVVGYFSRSSNTTASTQETALSLPLQPQNATIDKQPYSFSFTSYHIPSCESSGEETTSELSSDGRTDPTPTSIFLGNMLTYSISINDDFRSPSPQEYDTYQHLSAGRTNGSIFDSRENKEQQSLPAARDEWQEGRKGNVNEKRHAHSDMGLRSVSKIKRMQQLMENAQISIKVKLKRTKGEVWEVVNMQNTDDTGAVLTSQKQVDECENCFNQTTALTELTHGEDSPYSAQPRSVSKLVKSSLKPATTIFPEEPPSPHPNTISDSQLLSPDCSNPNGNDGLESAPLPQPPVLVDDTEQIGKLLEDIMMGLDILQPNHNQATATCQVLLAENDEAQSLIHARVGRAGSVYEQDFGSLIALSSADTDGNQPSYSGLSSDLQDSMKVQQQQCSHLFHSPCFTEQKMVAFSCEQKPHYPECQEQASQDDQNILEFPPLSGSQLQSLHSCTSPCLDDLRLPQCLSPLESTELIPKRLPILSSSTRHTETKQTQPSLHRRPWLAEHPRPLQYPLSVISVEDQRHGSSKNTDSICRAEQQQKDLQQIPQNEDSCEESCNETERQTKWASHNVKGKKSKPKIKQSLKCKQSDTKADSSVPKKRKRKHTHHPPDAAGSLAAYKEFIVSDEKKSRFSMGACSVSLSSNNVLAKEREMAASALNMTNKLAGKPNEPSNFTESLKEKTTVHAGLTPIKTRVRTRNLKETPKDTSLEVFTGLKETIKEAADNENNQEDPPARRKRGRPRKIRLDKGPVVGSSALNEQSSDIVNQEPPVDNNLQKNQEPEKASRRCRKRTRIAGSTGTTETDYNDDINRASEKRPKPPPHLSLKDFQKLIKQNHCKTRTYKECQDKKTNETAREESEGCRSEEPTKETGVGITEHRKTEGTAGPPGISNIRIDENHNHILNESAQKSLKDDPNRFGCKEASVFENKEFSLFSSDDMEEGVAKSSAERREQPFGNPERDCNQEHVDEEEEDLEVDVLLYSPDKAPPTGKCDRELEHVDVDREVEDEEEVSEIDVTGDEAE